ncbi:upstream activation factor subunit UAF30-like [Coffea arabica]|uniref:Upstream activation factor subunit UAF30-like n=1 Tax=Coffea arabica TaxID=13443 RepID=A0A6P6U0T5_COFAR|nr:upstream activation factor subunit UAF30-like [Coffea arabica]
MASTAGVFGNRCRALMAAAKTSVASTTAGSAAAKTPGRRNGILKKQPVSPALRQFVGAPETSRNDAVRKVWDYVKSKNLQNPNNKKEICCDEKLKTIFEGKEKVGFTEIAKLLSKHFQKAA